MYRNVVYQTAIGGGALILDKFPRAGNDEKSETQTRKAPISNVKTETETETEGEEAKPGQRRPAASEVEYTA
ncbi:MAG: hypothetical protein R8K48_10525 [Gallionella sp.]